jgi:S-DNA-T family DNA segregation ATPase FtsK/SpoIIIE
LSPTTKKRRFNELVGLLLLFVALIALLALLSYDHADPSWFSSESAPPSTQNWAGSVGANLAEGLLQSLGVVAFLFPVVLGIVGWNRFRGRGVAASYGRFLGHFILLLSLASLVNLLYGQISYGGSAPLDAGGMVGGWIASGLKAVLNTAGAVALSAAVVVAAIILTTRFSFGHMIEVLYRAVTRTSRVVIQRVRAILESRRKAAEKRAVIRKHSQRQRERESIEGSSGEAGAPAERAPRPSIPIPQASPGARQGAAGDSPAIVGSSSPEAQKPSPRPKPRQRELPLDTRQPGTAALPPLELLNEPEPQEIEDEKELLERARQLTEKFREFAVDGSVVAIHPGPVVTTFEFKPEAGVKYSKMTGMVDDLCLALKAESVRIDRMAGRSTVGIEVPNRRQEVIYPRELFASEAFTSAKSKLTLALGKNINGEVFVSDLGRMPHLLIAGATGAGKSVALNGMIASTLYKATPADVRFIMIDTKMIELGIYADIPHLLIPVVTDPKKASTALKWAVREMESRYRQLAAVGVRNIDQFNTLLEDEPDRATADIGDQQVTLEHLPYIVIVIDEMADLMMVSAVDVEESIMRLAQMARAVGIHIILATQRPSVDVITGTIKANFPARVAFRVSQRVDSRTIIDQQGAEHLLGRGDMLFLPPGSARLMRIHGGFITEGELNRITAFLKKQAKPIYDESILKDPDEDRVGGYGGGERDLMFPEAVRLVLQEGICSITLIQRRLRLGYARAARIVDMMEQEGIVGPADGSKPREVLAGPEILETLDVTS